MLDAQFLKLQRERVTGPFEADMARLNSGYAGGIQKKIAEEKAAGQLDAVLALEAEQKLIADKQPVPESDDESTPASLKTLRAVYRDAYARLGAQRAANLKALLEPLDKRLAQMEVDLTKANRLPDAKLVRAYRDKLKDGGTAISPTPAPAGTNTGNLLPITKGEFTNSLGMKFVRVKGVDVLFCIHETRFKDYASYATENPDVVGTWKNQTCDGVIITERAEDHPVIRVSWEDATAFCAWLSKREGRTYRLPTDHEWSVAAGLARFERKDAAPVDLHWKVKDEYPWGGTWPPPKDSGNFADAAFAKAFPTRKVIAEYSDNFATTAPVMSFKPNKIGIFDLGGNVWEWCEDWFDAGKTARVHRGGSWGNADRNGNLLSSYRNSDPPTVRLMETGFRCVIEIPDSTR